MKKTLAILLALVMAISMMTALVITSSAANSGDEDGIAWTFDPDTGKLTLVGHVEAMLKETYGSSHPTPWAEHKNEIKTAYVDGKVLRFVGKSALAKTSVEEIVFGEGITEFDRDVASEAHSLKVVYLPKSLVKIGRGVFYYCDNIEHIYYAGTTEDWAKVEISSEYNDALKDVECGVSAPTEKPETGDTAVIATVVALAAVLSVAVVAKKVRV